MAKRLRRYKYPGLKKVSKTQARLNNALLRYLPQSPFEHGFKDKLRASLEPLVHVDVDLWLDNVSYVAEDHLLGAVSHPPCVAVISLLPKPEKVLIEVDLPIAQQAIDRMLGGDATDVDAQRPLSEIEEGVLSFLLLKALSVLQSEVGNEQQLAMKLERVAGDLETLKHLSDTAAPYFALSFKLFFDVAVGYLRIFVPQSLVDSDLPQIDPAPGPALSRYLMSLQNKAGRVAAVGTDLHITVGQIRLAPDDLAGLEVEDIILVENTEVQLVGGACQGRVNCTVGEGKHGAIFGSLMVGESGKYEVAIDEIVQLEQPPDEGAVGDGEYQQEEDMAQGEDAVRISAPGLGAPRPLAPRFLSGSADPLPAARIAPGDEVSGQEHSDDEYEAEGDGEYEEDGGEEGDEEPLAESANLLNDVAVSMVVELGRVGVSAADVVQLRPGQVIELSRSPGDPVDLVVDNKRIGRGELVEIEGELGVRILSIRR